MAPLPDYADALGTALRIVRHLGRTESVELDAAGGRVLAEAIVADRDLPPFNRAQMDGYALRAADLRPGAPAFPVAATIAAGAPANVHVPPGQCVAIATGAPLPDDVDAVIPHELSDRGDRQGRPVQFTIDSIEPSHAVHRRGADAKRGDRLIETGTILAAHHLGIAAAVGKAKLEVAPRPRTVILTSGDEVVSVGESVAPHQIRNSNAPQVRELLRRFGAEMIHAAHLPDEAHATVKAVADALALECDLLVTVGGVSAGERDHFPAAFEAARIESALCGASIQPGRPIFIGRRPGRQPGEQGALVVALPGNPVSVLACACLFIWPIVRVMLGLPADLPWREVELAESVKPNAMRRAFRPAILHAWDQAVVPSWAGSGDLAHTAPTHGLLELPVQKPEVPAGTRLRFLSWP